MRFSISFSVRGKEDIFRPAACVFLWPVHFRVMLHPHYFIISSFSTWQIVFFLRTENLVCPEARVKGLVPTDSFRLLAFSLCMECEIAVVTLMPSAHEPNARENRHKWTAMRDDLKFHCIFFPSDAN